MKLILALCMSTAAAFQSKVLPSFARASKSALNIISKSLSVDLEGDNINSTLLHPGWVITEMVDMRGLITTTQSVSGMIGVLESKTPAELRGAWHAFDGKVIPW